MGEHTLDFHLPEGMMAIDGHIHIDQWSDGKNEGFDSYLGPLEAYREQNGMAWANVASIPILGGRDASQNMMAAILKLENPHYFALGGLVHPNLPVTLPVPEEYGFVQQVEELIDLGFDGLKMLEGKPNARRLLGLSFADRAFDAYFSLLEERQIHLLWHVNDPANFWDRSSMSQYAIDRGWCYDGPGFLSYEEGYQEVYTVLRRHPKLKVTFAHLFFLSEQPDRLVELLDSYPNVCVDITPGSEMYRNMSADRKLWREIFTRYADRILLGTDTYTFTPLETAKDRLETIFRFLLTEDDLTLYSVPIKGLGLDQETVSRILSGNFLRRVGAAPRKISREKLGAYIQKYLPLIKNEENRTAVQAYYSQRL